MPSFESAYEGTPPWDIGAPQPAFVRLARDGEITGRVLDSGCGTGENAMHVAAMGLEVLGVDAAPSAIAIARRKAGARYVNATFLVGDVLELDVLQRRFETIIDSGVFHVFDDADRARYVESLRGALAPHGRFHMLVFSDREPASWGGPRRVTREEIEQAFARGWRLRRVEEAIFHTNIHPNPPGGARAWLVTAERAD